MATFTFTFEELPLTIVGGFSAGLVDGSALISYDLEGEWCIHNIYLAGHKRIRWSLEEYADRLPKGLPCPPFEYKAVELDEGEPLYLMIYDRLEDEWRDKVQEEVNDHIAEDREEARAFNLEVRRDRLAGAF